ncbi:MAG: tetratricopeptide repeat protein, partial [Myxococcota bacterium]
MFDAAESHLREGRVAEAIEAFRALLSTDPDNGVLRGRVAEAYRQAGNVERAFHHFHKAAGLFIRADDLPGAVEMFEAADHLSPNEPDVLFRWAECVEQLDRINDLKPILIQLVASARASGDRRRLWALDRLAAIDPNNIDWAVARAHAMAEAGRLAEAVECWRRISADLDQCSQDWMRMLQNTGHQSLICPDYASVLAQVFLTNQQPREGLALLVPFYDEYPDNLEILETVIECLEDMQSWDRLRSAQLELLRGQTKRQMRGTALQNVAQLLRAYPTDPGVLRTCANTCQTFSLQQEAARLRFQLCQLHHRRDELDARDDVLTELLRDDPRHVGGLRLAISVLQDGGRLEEAKALFVQLKEVLRGDKEDSGASNIQARPFGEPNAVEFTESLDGHPDAPSMQRTDGLIDAEDLKTADVGSTEAWLRHGPKGPWARGLSNPGIDRTSEPKTPEDGRSLLASPTFLATCLAKLDHPPALAFVVVAR